MEEKIKNNRKKILAIDDDPDFLEAVTPILESDLYEVITATNVKKGGSMALETRARAWTKSFVWRVLGAVILGIISWIITHSWREMTIITVLFHCIRVILYYFHERLWERISWGRVKHPLSIFAVKKELEPQDLKLIQNQLRELGYID